MNSCTYHLATVVARQFVLLGLIVSCLPMLLNRGVWGQEPSLPKKGQPMFTPLINASESEFVSKYLFGDKATGGLPSNTEGIKRIHAEVYSEPPFGPKVERFLVPQSDISAIMACFRSAEIDPDPNLLLMESGSLTITTNDDVTRTITWFAGGKMPLCFSVKGIRCGANVENYDKVSDQGGILIGLIRDISKKTSKVK